MNLLPLLWLLLRRIGALIAQPHARAQALALMSQAEHQIADHIIAQAIALSGADPDHYDIRARWTRSGLLDFSVRLKPTVLLALARRALRERFRNYPRRSFNRFCQHIARLERRRANAARPLAAGHAQPHVAIPP